ncbi:MAG: hypothetical protein GY749_27765 [Desulfobacteraceae bacterium]|nr:hypothetical protein [Desulfobacteraceae bacterium]
MNRYKQIYIDNLVKTKNPYDAIVTAIDEYVKTRQAWLDGKGCLSWRGGWKDGRLFFNSDTTTNNISIMEGVQKTILSKWTDYDEKIEIVAEDKEKLSAGGKAKELIET